MLNVVLFFGVRHPYTKNDRKMFVISFVNATSDVWKYIDILACTLTTLCFSSHRFNLQQYTSNKLSHKNTLKSYFSYSYFKKLTLKGTAY